MLTLGIVLLIIFGIVLILLEFFVIPGVTIAGFGGVILIGGGIFLSYQVFGNEAGSYFLGGSLLAVILIIIYALRANTWTRLGLKNAIHDNVKTFNPEEIQVGQSGITMTRLNPMGKVKIGDLTVEARSIDGFIDEQKEVEIVEIEKNKIIIKQKI